MEVSEIFAKRVQERLTQKGWTHKRFAEELGIKPPGVSRVLGEKRSPGIETLMAWANALGVAPEWLLGGEGGRAQLEHDIDALKLKAISAIVSLVDIDDLGAIVDTIFEYLPPEERKKLSAP